MSPARRRPRAAAAVALVAMLLRLLLPLLHEHGCAHGHGHRHGDVDPTACHAGESHELVTAVDGDAALDDHHGCASCEFELQSPGTPPVAWHAACFAPWVDDAEDHAITQRSRWLACERPPSRAPPSLVV